MTSVTRGESCSATPERAAVAILSIGLGIGVSTAIFGAVDRILLAALPYPDAERVIALTDRTSDGAPLDVAYGNYVEIVQRNRSFETLAVADRWQPSLVATGEPERLEGDLVSADYFRVLGVNPSVGRNFEAADDVGGAPQVAIVTASFATRRFGSLAAVLDRQISLDGESYTVVGVMPEGFENALSPAVEVWAPLRYRADAPFQSGEWGHHLRMIGRLRGGVSLEQAQRDIGAISSSPTADFPRAPVALFEHGMDLASLQASVTADVRPALLAILGAVLLLLAIACANVANILLARALARRSELALRAALGAEHGRLVQQLFAESALVAVAGGVLGIGVAAIVSRALVLLAPASLPRLDTIGLDARVLAFAFVTTAVVALVVGLVPALRARELGAHSGLATGARVTSPGLLLLRDLWLSRKWRSRPCCSRAPGCCCAASSSCSTFRPVRCDARRHVAGCGARRRSSLERGAIRALRARARCGSRRARRHGCRVHQPVAALGRHDRYGVGFQALTGPDPASASGAFRYAVTPGWFETMRIPLKRGRLLGAEDGPEGAPAVVISESFAARRFGERDPIGAQVKMGPDFASPERPWRTVVGVVGDVKQTSLASASPDAFYVPMGQWAWVDDVQSLVVRTAGDPAISSSRSSKPSGPWTRRCRWSGSRRSPTWSRLPKRSGRSR